MRTTNMTDLQGGGRTTILLNSNAGKANNMDPSQASTRVFG